jgi:hypothetical protein
MADQQQAPFRCRCLDCRRSPTSELARNHLAINRVVTALDERSRRLFVGLLAGQHGRGGVALFARVTGLSRTTIRCGLAELRQGIPDAAGRVRRPGGGRRRAEKKRPGS